MNIELIDWESLFEWCYGDDHRYINFLGGKCDIVFGINFGLGRLYMKMHGLEEPFS